MLIKTAIISGIVFATLQFLGKILSRGNLQKNKKAYLETKIGTIHALFLGAAGIICIVTTITAIIIW